jgi:Xaa-Pro dipeptidase
MAEDYTNSIFNVEDERAADSESILDGNDVSRLIDESKLVHALTDDDPFTTLRRSDIDAKQEKVAQILAEMQCDGVILLMPAHVAWFTCGMNVRGLIADSERPGIYTNGKQRWLIASNIDSQRIFDEELNGLGFQLKEWQWSVGRAVLLGELVYAKKFATDRPFPNMPLITDKLRPHLRYLTDYERHLYLQLGQRVAHAVEATARNSHRGETEQEIAGQLAHRLFRHGVEASALSVAADDRAMKIRRAGFTEAKVDKLCVIQATGCRDGLYVTASRTVAFGTPTTEFKHEFELAIKLSSVYRSLSIPGQTLGSVAEQSRRLVMNSPYEHEWRHSQTCYGAGRFPVEELRKTTGDDKFAVGWPLVWQAKVGSAAIIDTVVVDEVAPQAISATDEWPFRRVKIRDRSIDVPDLLVRPA